MKVEQCLLLSFNQIYYIDLRYLKFLYLSSPCSFIVILKLLMNRFDNLSLYKRKEISISVCKIFCNCTCCFVCKCTLIEMDQFQGTFCTNHNSLSCIIKYHFSFFVVNFRFTLFSYMI